MKVTEAEKNFAMLVNKVYVGGITVDLERDDKVIARLTPAEPPSPLTVGDLNTFLRSLPHRFHAKELAGMVDPRRIRR